MQKTVELYNFGWTDIYNTLIEIYPGSDATDLNNILTEHNFLTYSGDDLGSLVRQYEFIKQHRIHENKNIIYSYDSEKDQYLVVDQGDLIIKNKILNTLIEE